MRVNQTGSNPVQAGELSSAKKTERAAGLKKSEKAGQAVATDEAAKAKISGKAKDAARAKDIASKTPDIREEKIAELKQRIAAGKYKVDAQAVADRMVDEHLQTNGLG